jgi:DNA-binding CsgD family transcriptional regulator
MLCAGCAYMLCWQIPAESQVGQLKTRARSSTDRASNDDIAERLVISPATATTHVNRTMMKLHARDRAQLVVIAYETGLLTPGRNPD